MNTRINTENRVSVGENRLATLVRRLGIVLKNARAAQVRTHRRRQAIRELRSLSDKELKDIGIARPQIREVVDGLLARQARAEVENVEPETSTATYGSHCHA